MNDFLKVVRAVDDISPAPTESPRRANDQRKTEFPMDLEGLLVIVPYSALWKIQSDLLHRLFEEASILGLLDGLQLCPDHLHTVAVQDSTLRQVD